MSEGNWKEKFTAWVWRNPILAAIVLVVFVVVAADGLVQAITAKHIVTVYQESNVHLTGASLLWALVTIISTVLAIALALTLAAAITHFKKQPPKANVTAVTAPDWLLSLPQTDIGNLDTILYWTQNPMMYTRPHLEGHSPYVDLYFRVFNASIFRLVMERTEGQIYYKGQPLFPSPEPVPDFTNYVDHGGVSSFGFRQQLNSSAVEQIRTDKEAHFDAGHFVLHFRYTDHLDQQRTLPKTFTGDVFRIQNTDVSEPQRELQTQKDEIANLRRVIDEKIKEREDVTGLLGGAQQALATCKRQFALARIRWFGDATRNPVSPWGFFHVTIEMADSRDRVLADSIAKILREEAQWSHVQVDPTLRSLRLAGEHKVMFVYDERKFDGLFNAFAEGGLLNCSIGVFTHVQPSGDLLIQVLPTAIV